MKPQRAVQSGDAYYYKKTGEEKGYIAPWEDGYRTRGMKGAFEWWYFDSRLQDDSSLVITFFAGGGKGRGPSVDVDYTAADGTQYSERITVSQDAFRSSVEGCDVRIGDCYFKGDLHRYDIYFKNGKLEIRVQLAGNVPAWRHETGHIFFGNHDEHYFAWLPAVPEGTVTADISAGGKTAHLAGTGYHDHNWGDSMLMMMKMMNHWYWGRAKVGEYQVISSYMTAGKAYGYTEFPIFMLAKGGQIIADDERFLRFTAADAYVDAKTKKPVHNRLIYDYDDGKQHYRVTYRRESDLSRRGGMGEVTGFKRLLAKLFGIVAPVYLNDIPSVVKEFILRLSFADASAYVFAVLTSGSGRNKSGFKNINIALAQHHMKLALAYDIQMPSSFQARDDMASVLGAVPEKIAEITKAIAEKRENYTQQGPAALPRNFRKLSFMYGPLTRMTVTEQCNGCGLCCKLCPTNNIELRDGKAVRGKNCIACAACANWCPQRAIESRMLKGHYHHPDVSAADLL